MAHDTLPDRDVLEGRLGEIQDQLYDVAALVEVSRMAAQEDENDIARTLRLAHSKLLHIAGATIDPMTLLDPTEAQEVANG